VEGDNGERLSAGGIDAFEASFQTTFPTSFNVEFDGSSQALDNSFGGTDFSDSFFMDATPDSKTKKKRGATGSNRDGVTAPLGIIATSQYGANGGSDRSIQDYADEIDAPMDEALGLFPNSAMDDFEPRFSNAQRDVKSAESPSRNTATRSRFERSERNEENMAPRDEAETDSEEHSPTLVLKRLQQRKAKASCSSSSGSSLSSPSTSGSGGMGGVSINDEMRKLDAIAHGLPTRESRRRVVRQPISYMEPSSKSKLRRGDVYFPKNGLGGEGGGSSGSGNGVTGGNSGDDGGLKDRQTNISTPVSSELLPTTAS